MAHGHLSKELEMPIRVKSNNPCAEVSILLITLIASFPSLAEQVLPQGVPASKLGSIEVSEIESSISQELQTVADKLKRLPGQKNLDVSVRLLTTERTLIIDLGKDSVPNKDSAKLEEQCGALITEAMPIVEGVVSVVGYECTYDGKNINYYYPEKSSARNSSFVPQQEDAPIIVTVSAGHGYFLNMVNNEWETRRPLMNGMQEDFVTPYYSRDVADLIVGRGYFSVAKARTNETTVHVPSGYPWWKMSARTYLEKQYPNNPEMWNSLDNDEDPDGQEDDDIRARPLFAEHIKSRYMLSIHTNGSENTAIRGTTGWYQPGRTEDAEYTGRILCAMKEVIQANPAYATWRVDLAPHSANKGENRLAVNNRATIIEIGFHSNAEDAAAMQDSVFRKLAVAGMAKGIRLYDEEKKCATFKIDSVPAVTGPIGTPFDYKMNYSGNPAFPITQYFEPVSCASGWNCSKGTRTTTADSSPLTFQIKCTGTTSTAGTFVYKRWLVDADGVKTVPVEHTYTCTPPA